MPGIGGAVLSLNDKKVYLCCGHTDMRKSINGLMTLVQSSFNLDPFNGALFAFCNRKLTLLKILEWDTDLYTMVSRKVVYLPLLYFAILIIVVLLLNVHGILFVELLLISIPCSFLFAVGILLIEE